MDLKPIQETVGMMSGRTLVGTWCQSHPKSPCTHTFARSFTHRGNLENAGLFFRAVRKSVDVGWEYWENMWKATQTVTQVQDRTWESYFIFRRRLILVSIPVGAYTWDTGPRQAYIRLSRFWSLENETMQAWVHLKIGRACKKWSRESIPKWIMAILWLNWNEHHCNWKCHLFLKCTDSSFIGNSTEWISSWWGAFFPSK